MRKLQLVSGVIIALLSISYFSANAQYTEVDHKEVPEGVIAVSAPGNYGNPGSTYMLTKDISSNRSTLFLGKDVTLDLNGYTLTYADGDYEHLPN